MLKRLERRGKTALAACLAPLLGAKRRGEPPPDPRKVERLLVIRQHNQMGDMLLAVPAFRGIRSRYPRARISLLAASINAGVMERNPYVDEVLTWSKERNRRNPLAPLVFIGGLRRRRFDMVIVLNTVSFSVTSMLIASLSGAGYRAGSTSRPFGSGLTSLYYDIELPLPSPDEVERMHEGEHNLYPLSVLGVKESDLSPVLVPSPDDRDRCAGFLSSAFGEKTAYALVHPGAGKAQNIWPPERFAAVTDRLSAQGIPTVAVRGPADGIFFERYARACGEHPRVVTCPGVGFLGELMRRAAVCVCNDTGVAHIGGAVGARCVEIFGPTDPSRWKPACDSVVAVCSADGDLGSVTVERIMEEVERFVSPGSGPGRSPA